MNNETAQVLPPTPEKRSIFTMAQQYIQLFLSITAVLTIFASVWLVAKLAPLYQSDAVFIEQIRALDKQQVEINSSLQQVQTDTGQIKSDVSEIKGYLKGQNETK